ncbi:MAG: hypothetical protein JRI34_09225 [Deltaproteobacteria bacterium]|nr:hypothetical protein [Deltaproteobacteria bacterium]
MTMKGSGVILLSCFLLLSVFISVSAAKDVKRIPKEQLKEMLDDPDVVVIDVRITKDIMGSKYKIKGAVREDPDDTANWAQKYDRGKTYVTY